MGKRLPHTPYSRIKTVLRRLWMWSRERNATLKRAQDHCELCGLKVGRTELEVHHIHGSNMAYLIEEIRKYLLVDPSLLKALCKTCHEAKHEEE